MPVTVKYELEEIGISTQTWNAILQTNFQKLDDHLHTRGTGTVGESVLAYQAVYWKSDGKLWLAQADGTKQPCIGVMLENGSAESVKRYQIQGPITNPAWSWASIGQPVYLSSDISGLLTQTPGVVNIQQVGFAQSATTLFLTPMPTTALIPQQPYDVGGTFPGKPTSSLVLLRLPMARAVVFPIGLTDSGMVAAVAATAETIFSIQKNGVEFGTATFAISGTVAVFASVAGATFAAGDILTLVAPGSVDATLANLGWIITGVR